MTYRPLTIERFGGLNLIDDPGEVAHNSAIDLLNVDFGRHGRLRQRDGYAKFTSSAAATRYRELFPFYTSDGTVTQLLAGRPAGKIDVLNTSGGVVATLDNVNAAATNVSFVRFGGPGASNELVLFFTYIANSRTAVLGGYWNGTTGGVAYYSGDFGHFHAITSDQRLCGAGYFTDSAARAMFSDPGAALTGFPANNYVDLGPGDGEGISGIGSFRELTIIFKPSQFYVFYGNSVDSTGQPIFNYRTVNVGIGCSARHGVASSPRGLYFVNRRGIYLTQGAEPTLISRIIDPIFLGGASSFFASSVLNQAQIDKCELAWVNERLHFAYPSGVATANDRLFVYDPAIDVWTLWDIPAGGMASFRVSNAEDLMFSYASGTNNVGRHSSSYTDDAGSNITSRYRLGFFESAGQTAESVIREAILDGIGTVAVKGSTNWGSLGTATNVTLGTSPATAQGRARVAQRGRQHSYQFEGVSGGAWTLNDAAFHVRDVRQPGLKAA